MYDFYTPWSGCHQIKYWVKRHLLKDHPGLYLGCYSQDKDHLLRMQTEGETMQLPTTEMMDESYVPPGTGVPVQAPLPESPVAAQAETPVESPSPVRRSTRIRKDTHDSSTYAY
jgi:hypothetical protein